ncbi:hypothetical protein P280DRAFT_394167 [Massarina eburnea CBS 473.64]|uniref:Zn(2)-C6 fungal-type domain-containing protein n=1 Tax=Massarina eburnea CBS 473.64 TaxID=1395130 RepID=A0A6A6S6W7_9PLEO|nr:hypothetical protein P280DRAFT_394167 [Massarina eburnea CBS 473.64]
MLGYISSTRKKSCRQCVKAKRRCDLGYPCCKRCFTKALDCAYPNASVREAEVIIRQATPDLALPPTTATSASSGASGGGIRLHMEEIDPALLQAFSDSSASASGSRPEKSLDFESIPIAHPWPQQIYRRPRTTPPQRPLVPHFSSPTFLNDPQVIFLISGMCAFVPALAYNGHNTFIHSHLYEEQQPSAYQDSVAISALYMVKTQKNITVLAKSMDAKIAALIASSHSWTLEEHLAAVQALITYQLIRLFDPTMNLQSSAIPHNHLLAVWTAHLWKRSFAHPLTLPDCHASWVFYESLRRTVMISVFLRGAWSCVTRGGLCDQVPVLARLPLTTDDKLWVENKNMFESRTPCRKKAEALVAYGEWSARWDGDPRNLSDFQRLLLVACRGQEDPRLLQKEPVLLE